MTKEYDNTNRGLMYRNEAKEQDNHPDFKGSINVNGQEFWLSGWTKDGREGTKLAGRKYFSLSVKPKDDAPAKPQPKKQAADVPYDDIPF